MYSKDSRFICSIKLGDVDVTPKIVILKKQIFLKDAIEAERMYSRV